MNLSIKITLLFIFLFSSLRANEISEIDRLHDEIISSTVKEIETDYALKLVSVGGSTLNGVRSFSLGFRSEKTLTIQEARNLIVHCEKKLINNINSNTAIRQFLVEYPFPASRVDLSISSPEQDNTTNTDQLDYASVIKGKIRYFSNKKNAGFGILLEESYEEALKKTCEEPEPKF